VCVAIGNCPNHSATFCGATFGVTGTLVEILGLMMPGAALEVLMTEGRDSFGELDLHLFGQ
jgi:hypothetical protein